jgi:hypothetical protein
LVCNTLGIERRAKFQDGTRKNDKHLITHMDLHETKQVG